MFLIGHSRRAVHRAILSLTTILASGGAMPAFAQTPASTPPPVRATLDENGVDLATGMLNASYGTISIGDPSAGGLTFSRVLYNGTFRDTMYGNVSVSGAITTVALGSTSEKFTLSGSAYTNVEGTGSTLTGSGGSYTYTTADGTKVQFTRTPFNSSSAGSIFGGGTTAGGSATGSILSNITRIDGSSISFFYSNQQVLMASTPSGPTYYDLIRLRSVTTSAGYRMTFAYQKETVNGTGELGQGLWLKSISTFNTKVDTCTSVSVCSATGVRPSLTIGDVGASPQTYSDGLNRTTAITPGTGTITIRRPSSSVATFVATVDNNNRVTQVTADGVVTNYTYADLNGVRTVTVSKAGLAPRTVTFQISTGLVKSDQDEVGNKVSYTYNSLNQLTQVDRLGGTSIVYVRDARGNATSTTVKAKAGSGVSDIITSAAYPCTNVAACNQPMTTTDGSLNVTNYEYNSIGQLTVLTLPAVTTNATRPQTRLTYTMTGGVSLLTGVSQCATAANCSNGADETKTTIAYDVNLRPSTITRGAGDGTLTAAVAVAYDPVGNRASIDGPLTGTADTTRWLYDAVRQLTEFVGPDPDGTGSLKNSAIIYQYNPDGQVTTATIGTANADGSNFAGLQQTNTSYNANGRTESRSITAGGTTFTKVAYGYDTAGRVTCAAQRMDPAQWSTQTDPCTPQTSGPNGADRIEQRTYDAVDRLTVITSGLGTSAASTEKTSYTPTGTVAAVTDGNGNVTTYTYDGFDRPWRACYQTTTNAACAGSPADYEQLTYDPNGNVTNRRLRDGQSIGYTYDALGRITLKDLPGSEADTSYSYDLLNRPLVVQMGSLQHSFTWDALGRQLGESQPFGSMSYQYDAAGRRTRQTWNDGFYVTTDYDMAGNVTAMRENGAASGVGVLASYTYDNLGRRTGIARGNGTTTTYAFDAVSRLSQLTQDLSGTGADLALGFGYNPAGQIVSATRSNDAYAWNGAVSVNRPYSANGLNQLTASGSVALGYDARGNLTGSGGSSYAYTSENLLKSVDNGTTLYYDALGRLSEYDTSVSTRFLYDGAQMAAEIANPGGAVMRRYVYGPGSDEPIVWYEGAGTGDRRWLHTDERGSVIAVSDASGATIATKTYDEYGIPGSGNVGRFQYTGQAFLPEIGLSYYKARIYSPTLGRFMQTDPIGYGDGMNWYNYVGSDPVNRNDPSGMDARCGIGYYSQRVNLHSGASEAANIYPATDVPVTSNYRCNADPSYNPVGSSPNYGAPPEHSNNYGSGTGTPRAPQSPKPCMATLGNSGRVSFVYTNVGASAGGTASHTIGTFVTANGYKGSFSTTAVGINLGSAGASVGVGSGSSRNLDTFSASNYNVGVNLGYFNYTRNYATDSLEKVGDSAGLETPSAGVTGTYSFTKLSNVTC